MEGKHLLGALKAHVDRLLEDNAPADSIDRIIDIAEQYQRGYAPKVQATTPAEIVDLVVRGRYTRLRNDGRLHTGETMGTHFRVFEPSVEDIVEWCARTLLYRRYRTPVHSLTWEQVERYYDGDVFIDACNGLVDVDESWRPGNPIDLLAVDYEGNVYVIEAIRSWLDEDNNCYACWSDVIDDES